LFYIYIIYITLIIIIYINLIYIIIFKYKDCFGIMKNRNKENLKFFKLAQSADEVYKGSYRYEDPAYIFLKEINKIIIYN